MQDIKPGDLLFLPRAVAFKRDPKNLYSRNVKLIKEFEKDLDTFNEVVTVLEVEKVENQLVGDYFICKFLNSEAESVMTILQEGDFVKSE